MTRITQSDQVLILLREQLQRLGRGKAARSGKAGASARTTPPAVARLQARGSVDDLSEQELGRTLVKALLAEELSEQIANDPAFQSVAEDVFRIIGGSEEGRALLRRAAVQLRQGK
jgi:hypothetical protein